MKRTRGMLRFASIGLLTMTPGMAHAETYQEHYMRLSKASKAIAPFADAWRTCVIRRPWSLRFGQSLPRQSLRRLSQRAITKKLRGEWPS